MTNHIFLYGLKLNTKIGVPDWERAILQELIIDVDIELKGNEKFKSKSDCQCHRNSLRDHESCLSLAVFASFTTLLKLEFMILFAPNAKCVQHIQKYICLNYICPNCEGPSLRDHGSPHRVCHWLCSPLSPHS